MFRKWFYKMVDKAISRRELKCSESDRIQDNIKGMSLVKTYDVIQIDNGYVVFLRESSSNYGNPPDISCLYFKELSQLHETVITMMARNKFVGSKDAPKQGQLFTTAIAKQGNNKP